MIFKKNWFYQLSISLSIIGMLYILICGFSSLGEGQEYSYLPKGILLLTLFGVWLLVQLLAHLSARFGLAKRLSKNKKWVLIVEAVFVVVVLAGALTLRIIAIQQLPMKPASDYKTFYEIAELLKNGTLLEEGKGYCNYIAMFPHVIGYCFILKTAFTWFGTSVVVGQYVNIAFSVATVFLAYRIGRKLGGRITGIIGLLGTAFWPSQILYVTMLSAEYAFTFLLYACILLFISLVKDYDENTEKATRAIVLHVVLGIMIALTAAIRPMAIIFLLAIIICLFPLKMKLPNIPRNDIPLKLRLLEKGWLRCILIIVPYMIISGSITTNIEMTINKTLPSSSTSFGYNLLVGLNTESIGGWNDNDADLLYSSMEKTGSASQAHITCRDLAFVRLTTNPKGMLNLFIEKYELLWGNDDYGSTWNISFLKEQGELTPDRSDFLYKIRDYNNIIYIVTIFFGLIAMIYFLNKKGSFAYILSLIFLGTAALHMFVESQNRYHYFVLQAFVLLAGMGIHFIFEDKKKYAMNLDKNKSQKIMLEEINKKKLESQEMIEEKITEIREEILSNTFDMKEALKNGHVIMTVSQAYADNDTDFLKYNRKTNVQITEADDAGEEVAATLQIIDDEEKQ